MKMTKIKMLSLQALILATLIVPTSVVATNSSEKEPLIIQEQGSFASGGSVITSPGNFDSKNMPGDSGQTLHGV